MIIGVWKARYDEVNKWSNTKSSTNENLERGIIKKEKND